MAWGMKLAVKIAVSPELSRAFTPLSPFEPVFDSSSLRPSDLISGNCRSRRDCLPLKPSRYARHPGEVITSLKKLAKILIFFLVMVFVSRTVSYYSFSAGKITCYSLELEEKESSDKSETEGAKEKDSFEEDELGQASAIVITNHFIINRYAQYQEKRSLVPYFEICLPPPELI
jgi:hypothetical protein